MIGLQHYDGLGLQGFGTASMSQVQDLNKALSAGYETNPTLMTGGSALRVESLETRLMLTLPIGIEATPLFQLGYLDVTAYAGVNKTGAGDSTAGIQEAIDDAFECSVGSVLPSH